MREEKILIDNLKINFKTIGEGKPFLILHGWGSNSERWQKVGELLAKSGLRVIIPDLPGFGNSQRPFKAWGLDEYCGFVQEFIEFINLEDFYLLGHSFGGALAIKFSLKFPDKINKLFLIGAACFRRKTLKKKILYIISKTFKVFSFIPFLRKAFYRFLVKSDYLSTEGVIKNSYLKIIKEDLSDILPKVQVPTIIIWGEKDNVVKLKDAQIINQKIKNSKLIVIPEGNHDLEQRIPEELSSLILKELSSSESL